MAALMHGINDFAQVIERKVGSPDGGPVSELFLTYWRSGIQTELPCEEKRPILKRRS
jgi:hypothetical protein